MLRPLSIAAGLTGMATLVSVACSGTFEPTRAFSRQPGQASSKGPALTEQQSGTSNRLQAVSPVNPNVVWASGVAGTFVVTTDGGTTWRAGTVAGAEALEFRDVQGVSAQVAYLMSADTGTASRIYKTNDGGQSWTLQFQNQVSTAFYDCFAFWDANRGIAFSDPVDSRFTAIRTTNGKTWTFLPQQTFTLAGEFAFAASGTCVATQGDRRAWIATGGAKARVLATTNAGSTWTPFDTPIPAGEAAGVFSVAFRDQNHGVIAGGNLATPDVISANFARSSDGGQSWKLTTEAPIPGAVFGLSYVRGQNPLTVVATGPGGAAWSSDEGETWSAFKNVTGFWAVAFASRDAGWLVGTEGRILKASLANAGTSN